MNDSNLSPSAVEPVDGTTDGRWSPDFIGSDISPSRLSSHVLSVLAFQLAFPFIAALLGTLGFGLAVLIVGPLIDSVVSLKLWGPDEWLPKVGETVVGLLALGWLMRLLRHAPFFLRALVYMHGKMIAVVKAAVVDRLIAMAQSTLLRLVPRGCRTVAVLWDLLGLRVCTAVSLARTTRPHSD